MPTIRGRHAHVFSKTRPGQTGEHPIHLQPAQDTHFREIPPTWGKPPYHLDLRDIIPQADYNTIVRKRKLTFHLNGDMGGIKYGVPQELVARGMEADFARGADASEKPSFLYIVGDCVYFNGETSQYYAQFYQPYEYYQGPIFAIPGNHDGENVVGQDSLDGFIANFVTQAPIRQPYAGESHRTTMVQPNVYWTLRTPLVNIVGLYSNVPAGGEIRSPQTEWLVEQLRRLPRRVPLFVALHHAVYSADNHHSGSTAMKEVLEAASRKAGRHADMVLTGHVHDYQRLTKTLSDGTQIPYLLTGAGGYHNLHSIMKVDGEKMAAPVTFSQQPGDPVTLDRYSDDHHGFLRMEVTPEKITGRYYEVPRPQEPYTKGNQLLDYFEFDWRKHRYIANSL